MDPVQCFNDMVSAFIAKEWTDARSHAFALEEWLTKGGFFSMDRRDTEGFCRILDRVCRNHLERRDRQ